MKLLHLTLIIFVIVSFAASTRLHSSKKKSHLLRHKSENDAAPVAAAAKKKDTSGAGPADVNAEKADATGIETIETKPPVKACTQLVGVDGKRIKDIYNYCEREDAHLQMNIWNVNVFAKKDDASSLIESIEWSAIDFPVRNITGAPECLLFSSEKNNKKFAFCFAKEDDLDQWYTVIMSYKMCRDGITPGDASKRARDGTDCQGAQGSVMNVTDPLTGRVISVNDQRVQANLGGGAGKGGCVNCKS